MADNENLPMNDSLSDVLANITANKALMEQIADIMGNTAATKPPEANSISDVLSNPDLMAKLPEVMAVLRPMLSGGDSHPAKQDGKGEAAGRRLALLYALKPYLSPRRCEAIDYFARMSKMGDLMKNIKL